MNNIVQEAEELLARRDDLEFFPIKEEVAHVIHPLLQRLREVETHADACIKIITDLQERERESREMLASLRVERDEMRKALKDCLSLGVQWAYTGDPPPHIIHAQALTRVGEE